MAFYCCNNVIGLQNRTTSKKNGLQLPHCSLELSMSYFNPKRLMFREALLAYTSEHAMNADRVAVHSRTVAQR